MYVSYRVERIRKSTGPEQWLIPTRTLQTLPDFLTHSVETDSTEETSDDLIDPESDIEVQCHIATTTDSHRGIGSHRFVMFFAWQPLVRAMASLIRVAQSLTSEKASSKQDCNGWHLCSTSHTHQIRCLKQRLSSLNMYKRKHIKLRCCFYRKGMSVPKAVP